MTHTDPMPLHEVIKLSEKYIRDSDTGLWYYDLWNLDGSMITSDVIDAIHLSRELKRIWDMPNSYRIRIRLKLGNPVFSSKIRNYK